MRLRIRCCERGRRRAAQWAAEGLQAMLAQHGPARTVAWARASADAETRIAALAVLEQVPLVLNLLAELERAKRTGNPKKVERVNRLLARLAGASKDDTRA